MMGRIPATSARLSPGKKFVEDQQVRLQGDGLGEFQAFQISLRQRAGELVSHPGIALEADFLQEVKGHGIPVAVFSADQFFYPR